MATAHDEAQSDEREFWLEMRRAHRHAVSAIEKRHPEVKPLLHIPFPLHETDERELSKHYRIVHTPRP